MQYAALSGAMLDAADDYSRQHILQQSFNGSNKFGTMKIVLAKGSSSHPGWINREMTCRAMMIVLARSVE